MARPDPYDLALGRRIREAREAKGRAQSRVEREASLPFGTVAQAERGEATLSVLELVRIAVTLDVDPAALIPPVDGTTP